MSDSDILRYLLSHAPLSKFYLFTHPETEEILMKYFDSTGASWNLMEDDDLTVSSSVSFLKRSGVKDFKDYRALLDYERNNGTSTNH